MSNKHVFEDKRTEDGSHLYSAVYLDPDGFLVIEIHDLGPRVKATFGSGLTEYEASEVFDLEQTARLRKDLGENLIAAIAERFPTSSAELTKHAESIGIGRGKIWNRIGD